MPEMGFESLTNQDSPKDFSELFTALEQLVPNETKVGARGATYGTRAFRLEKPKTEDVSYLQGDLVMNVKGNENLTEEEDIKQFMHSLDAHDQTILAEVSSAAAVTNILRQKIENAYSFRYERGDFNDSEHRFADSDNEEAIQQFAKMFQCISQFVETMAKSVKSEKIQEMFVDYAREVKEIPDTIKRNFSKNDTDEESLE